MCGIVGYVGSQQAAPLLLEGLGRLEHRGYDSAGVAVLSAGKGLKVVKKAGRVRDLEAELPKRFAGKVGVGHTRWATHGPANDVNAHPHVDAKGNVAVVHNGIIDNAAALRAELTDRRDRPGLRHRHRGGRAPGRAVGGRHPRGQGERGPAADRGHLRPGGAARRLPGPDRGRPQRQPADHRRR